MVFLSLSRWVRSRGPDRYWRVQEVLKHARVSERNTGNLSDDTDVFCVPLSVCCILPIVQPDR